jgi:hypothetical protein
VSALPRSPRLLAAALLACAFSFALFFAAPAAAATISGEEVAEIRTVIYRQIEALRQDRAREAFALAAPQMRATFRSPEHFMRETRASYAPLYRSSSVAFKAVWIVDHEVVQQVSVTDASGAQWSAFYPMERQRDGSWKTRSWRLVPATQLSM